MTELQISDNEISNITLTKAYLPAFPAVVGIIANSSNAFVNANRISGLTSNLSTYGITFGYASEKPTLNVFSCTGNTITELTGGSGSLPHSFYSYMPYSYRACWQITDNVIENNGYIDNVSIGDMSYLYTKNNTKLINVGDPQYVEKISGPCSTKQ
ncbi:MAG: hypothetical protein NTZ52_02465 [Chlamydiae bacterium]|nr:hypothetical protein [Chlamydiota bacterium]